MRLSGRTEHHSYDGQNRLGNDILTGFNPKPASENPDVNVNALCGNQGGVSGNGSTRINNMTMHIYKKASGYGYRATTLWI